MKLKFKASNPNDAKKYFEDKVNFTTGPAELKYIRNQGEKLTIIDVRTADDYAEGHIPGAINLPEDQWPTLRGLQRDKPNIVYCYSVVCHLAARASAYFAGKGYSVMELEGGMESWRDYEYEEEKGDEKGRKIA